MENIIRSAIGWYPTREVLYIKGKVMSRSKLNKAWFMQFQYFTMETRLMSQTKPSCEEPAGGHGEKCYGAWMEVLISFGPDSRLFPQRKIPTVPVFINFNPFSYMHTYCAEAGTKHYSWKHEATFPRNGPIVRKRRRCLCFCFVNWGEF